MPLRITLKPKERLIINGACIRNGDRAADLLVETRCKFLRESEIIRESEADTPCKKLAVTLQLIYLSDEPSALVDLFVRQAVEVMELMPSAAPSLAEINARLDVKEFHAAIKAVRKLITHEQHLLECGGKGTRAA